jgi:hypothetical protein
MVKIWLDDKRPAPAGWILCKDPEDALLMLNLLEVEEMSLDHDLAYWNSEGREITGYDVLNTIEQWAASGKAYLVPKVLRVHSANPAVYKKMEDAIRSIRKRAEL